MDFGDPFHVRAKVAQDGWRYFYFASSALKADPEFVTELVISQPLAFRFASHKLRSNADFVLRLVQTNGLVLRHAARVLRSEVSVVRMAVLENPGAIRFASMAIRDDPDLMLDLVYLDGTTFQHASAIVRDDYEVAHQAVRRHGMALCYASVRLQQDEYLASWGVLTCLQRRVRLWRRRATEIETVMYWMKVAANAREEHRIKRANEGHLFEEECKTDSLLATTLRGFLS